MILQASIQTRKVEEKFSKKFGFWHLQKTGFGREPQNEPQDNLRVQKSLRKVRKNTGFLIEIRCFYGCGGRTRTYDLRVMSPTSFQLLYSAIFCCTSHVLMYYSMSKTLCQPLFSLSFGHPSSQEYPQPNRFSKQEKSKENEGTSLHFAKESVCSRPSV